MKHLPFAVLGLLLAFMVSAMPANAQSKKKVNIKGTVIDVYCDVTMGMGGEAHKQCAVMCAKNGAPLGIKEEKTGTLYMTAGQQHMVYASAGLEKYVEEKVTVKGTVYEKDGVKMIVVDSVAPAQ